MLPIFFFVYRFRILLSGVLVIAASLVVLCAAAIALPVKAPVPHDPTAELAAMSAADGDNAVTGTVSMAVYQINKGLDGFVYTASNGLRTAGFGVMRFGSVVGNGIATGAVAAVHGVGAGFTGVGRGIMFVVRIPGNIFGHIVHGSMVSAVIRPADHNAVPVIDPNDPSVLAAKEKLYSTPPPSEAAPVVADTAVVWPIHGMVTTQFGEPEWPYQAVHTGLDISDGNRIGTSPIVAFRHGKVIDVEHTGGLGNHVVVEHGSGVTSVYGHMASISVQVGQEVTTTTVLGYEGTTGVSTGPHLHFEIRVDGQATDPHQFIPGQP